MKNKTKKQRLIILDSHAIIHRAYHALPDFVSDTGEPTGALYGLSSMIMKIIVDLQPDYLVAAYDLPKETFRHHAFKEYKGTRKVADDALVSQINRSRDVLHAFGIPIYEMEGFEADDILGTIAKKMKRRKELEVLIASGDMDTLQLVDGDKVRVYTLKRGLNDTIIYDEKAVEERFGFSPKLLPDYKGLRGDPSDNIPGVPGIGEKTATTLITNFGSLENIYTALEKDEEPFREAGITPRIINLLKEHKKDATFSKMLGTIHTDVPITFRLPRKAWNVHQQGGALIELFEELGFRSLKERLKRLLGIEEELFEEEKVSQKELEEAGLMVWILNSNITNPTLEDIYQYANVRDFAKAKAVIQKKLREEPKLYKLYTDIEKPLIPVIHAMEDRGICVDVAVLQKISKKLHAELIAVQRNIFDYAGNEFNVNSPKQLADVLFEKLELKPKNQKKTSTGQRSTRESELEKIQDEHPIIKEILEYRSIQKLLSTYVDPLPNMLGDDGRLHAEFIQTGTTTGRLSSQNPNLQNIPTKTPRGRQVREAFVPAKGYTLVSFDYSQIELRIAAFLSGDEHLINVFKEGKDVHSAVAMAVFGVSQDNVTKEMRTKAKAINFGILYGMGVNALKKAISSTQKEAHEYLKEYFTTYHRLQEFLEETKGYARRYGYTETLYGRRRYFDGITSPIPFVRASAERMALNAPIQGTQADIIKIAMVRIHDHLEKNKIDAHLLLQVHDELVFEMKNTKDIPVIQNIMESVVSQKETKGVPLLVNVSSGSNWGNLQKV